MIVMCIYVDYYYVIVINIIIIKFIPYINNTIKFNTHEGEQARAHLRRVANKLR